MVISFNTDAMTEKIWAQHEAEFIEEGFTKVQLSKTIGRWVENIAEDIQEEPNWTAFSPNSNLRAGFDRTKSAVQKYNL